MERLKAGNRIKLSGGYDMNPEWLKGGPGYFAVVTGFFDNSIPKRHDDSRISASIEFESELEHQGFSGRYGFIMGRWQGQTWDKEGTVHVHIANVPINKASDITEENNVWAESHADYETIGT